MVRLLAVLIGVATWAAVGTLAVVIAFNIGEKNQVLMFLPILGGVVAAWGIGEALTERGFSDHEGGGP